MTALSVLALDLAKKSGYAQWTVGERPRSGTFDAAVTEDIGKRLASLYKWGLKRTKEWGVTDIVIEAPITAAMPGSAAKTIWLVSAFGVLSMLGAQYGIRVTPIANITMAIHWMGTRDIPKKQRKTYSVLEAQRRGFRNVTDHNEADALGLLSLRCCQLNIKTPWESGKSPGPLFTGAHAPQGVTITKANEVRAAVIVNKVLADEGTEK